MKSSWCEYEYKSRSVGIGWHKYIIYSIHIYIYIRVLRVSTGRWYRQTDVSWPWLCFGMKYAMAFACCHMVDRKMRIRKHVLLLMSEILWLNWFNYHKAASNVALLIMLNITWYTDISEQTNDSKACAISCISAMKVAINGQRMNGWVWVMRWLYHSVTCMNWCQVSPRWVCLNNAGCMFWPGGQGLNHQICCENVRWVVGKL